MTRLPSSLPVCHTEGIGNWQADADSLIPNELLFTAAPSRKRAVGKLKSTTQQRTATERNPHSAVPPSGIQRCYRPTSGVVDPLVEVLYHLLVCELASSESQATAATPDLHSRRPGVRNVL